MQRIHYLVEHMEPAQQAFRTIDPAPAAPESTPTPELREQLLDEQAPIFERYRALFALRNQARTAVCTADKACCTAACCVVTGTCRICSSVRWSGSAVSLS